jgi:hypothetical protein
MAKAPEPLHDIEEYGVNAVDIKTIVVEEARALSGDDFQPTFKHNNWKLIQMGSMLGFLISKL